MKVSLKNQLGLQCLLQIEMYKRRLISLPFPLSITDYQCLNTELCVHIEHTQVLLFLQQGNIHSFCQCKDFLCWYILQDWALAPVLTISEDYFLKCASKLVMCLINNVDTYLLFYLFF